MRKAVWAKVVFWLTQVGLKAIKHHALTYLFQIVASGFRMPRVSCFDLGSQRTYGLLQIVAFAPRNRGILLCLEDYAIELDYPRLNDRLVSYANE